MPRDGDLIKRTPGTPLSEAELRQRREAAKARWALAAGAAVGGAGAGAALAHREIRQRRRAAWAEVRQAQRETVGAERARHAAVIRRMEQVHETGRKAVSHGWPVPIYRSVVRHDINRTRRDIRAMPAEFMGYDSDGNAAWAPHDQQKLRSFFDEIERLKGVDSELANARKPRSVKREGGAVKVPEAHDRTIKRRLAPDPARIKVAETQLERARQALEALRGADAEAGLDDMEMGDNFGRVHDAAERRIRSAEARLAQEKAGRVIKDTIKVGARRSASEAERKVVRQTGRVRVQGNPDDKALKRMRRELLRRLQAWHGDRVGREHVRHIQAMPVARAHARGRFSAALSQVPGKALRGKLIGAAGLLGGALTGAAAYAAYRPSRVEKLAKFAAAPDPADVLQDAGDSAEQTIGERLADTFRRWRDAPAAQLLEPGADLKADIERGLRRAIAPVSEAMNRGAGAVPRMADVTPDEAMSVVFSFDARNPRVASYIEQYREQRVRELADEQADTIRATILAGAMTGASTETMARQVRESIGLTAAQAAQVANFRAQLVALDPKALQRQLRDRRFDPTVLRAIRDGRPLSDEQVNKMVDAYHRRYLAYRATTIARTEGVGAANNGHVAALKDWLAQNPNYTVVKTWIATRDARTRPDHVHLHGQVVAGIDSPFRCENGDTIRWPGDQDAPARQTINCFPADTLVQGGVLAATRVKYVGPMIEITTRSGAKLTITPNHPVLTPGGFAPADALREGEYVLRHGPDSDVALGAAMAGRGVAYHPDQAPARIEDVFRALELKSGSVSVDLAVDDLYGDMRFGQGQIEIVAANRELLGHLQAERAQSEREIVLEGAAVGQSREPGDGAGNVAAFGVDGASPGGVSSGGLSLDRLGVELQALPLDPLRVGPASEIDVRRQEAPSEQRPADALLSRELIDAGAGAVSLDQIIQVRKFDFAGHVYDLETVTGWMVAESIITSNCRCTLSTRIVPRVQPVDPSAYGDGE